MDESQRQGSGIITLPRRVLRRFDALAQAAGKSRSGSIAHPTLAGAPADPPSRMT